MSVTRRIFIRNGALAVVGTAALPSFLTRAAFASPGAMGKKRLVVLFQRGAADGLNMVVPWGEDAYYKMRPTIAIPRPNRGLASVIDLDGFFGLHPSMEALKPLWDAKQLAIVHAAGSPDNTRSHFDAQDYMESGTPGVKSTEDGWLNRALQAQMKMEREAKASPFRAVSLGTALPRTLAGSAPAVAISNINDFGVGGRSGGSMAQGLSNSSKPMYKQSVDTVLPDTVPATLTAWTLLK